MSESIKSHLKDVHSNSVTDLDAGVSATQVVRQLRRSWVRRIAWRTFWLVGVPTILAFVYYALWASNQYESVSIITLQWAEQSSLPHSDSILGTASTPVNSSREVLSIRDYLLSHSMFDEVDRREHLTQHYQSRHWDVFSKLSNPSTREQAYRYYLGKVAAEFDSSSGSLSVRVRAFEPKMAQRINESILVNSEALLENQSERAHAETLLNAEKLVNRTREKLIQAKRQMSHFQDQVVADDAGITRGNSPRQSAGVADIANSSTASSKSLNESKLRAVLELEYAEKAHQASIAMVTELQAVEIRRPPHFVVISKPSLPDYSTYPRRLASVLTVLTFSFLLMGIGTLTWAAIREHARV